MSHASLSAMHSELSSDVWLIIFRFCERSCLLQLDLVSRDFHTLCQPLIYRDINLSIHNSEIPHPILIFITEPEGMIPIQIAEEKLRQVQTAQKSFLGTLLQHPEYALLVHRLTWTLTFGSEWDDRGEPVENILHPHSQTWRVFLSLQNVRYLDLASIHYLMRHSYVRDCPEHLFPAVTFVRLSGVMNERLIASIISHHPARLEHIRLEHIRIDNVQHWGYHADGTPLTSSCATELVQQRMKEDIYPHGPIRGILNASTRYPNLKHLYLRKAGSRSVSDIEWVPEADIEVYKEWASFITSVKSHVTHLTFEQAAPPDGWYVRSCNQTRRPMDQRFHDWLLPVFLQKGWKNLEVLHIRGVGRWQQEDPIVMNDSTRAAIADAIGPNSNLIIEEAPCKPAYIWDPPAY